MSYESTADRPQIGAIVRMKSFERCKEADAISGIPSSMLTVHEDDGIF